MLRNNHALLHYRAQNADFPFDAFLCTAQWQPRIIITEVVGEIPAPAQMSADGGLAAPASAGGVTGAPARSARATTGPPARQRRPNPADRRPRLVLPDPEGEEEDSDDAPLTEAPPTASTAATNAHPMGAASAGAIGATPRQRGRAGAARVLVRAPSQPPASLTGDAAVDTPTSRSAVAAGFLVEVHYQSGEVVGVVEATERSTILDVKNSIKDDHLNVAISRIELLNPALSDGQVLADTQLVIELLAQDSATGEGGKPLENQHFQTLF